MTFALYFGNRGFFPGELIKTAREEMTKAVNNAGFDYILLDEDMTKFGAIETMEDGKKYAAFLKKNEGKYDGVIFCLPNFGDENGAIAALRDCGVPIFIQAYPDEIGKMDFAQRRDSFCGKFSIMDVFCQYNLPFTVFEPHTVHPSDKIFEAQLKDFAAVCRVVRGMKRFKVGAIGARTTAFKTVRYDELTLEKYGITVEAFDLSELIIRTGKIDSGRVNEKINRLKSYTNFDCVPEGKIKTLAEISVSIDDMIKEYDLDCIALRCWNEIEQYFGVSPCVLLSELNDRGIVATCELDICNAVAMHALSLASEEPAICLDWNNNYGEDPDKCILFHCGPVAQSLMTKKGTVSDHKMFSKSYGEGCGWGCNEGRIAAFDMTFASAKTDGGKLTFYTGQGVFTEDEIEKEFFGCGGVAKIDDLQKKLIKIGRNGYRHHVSVTKWHVEKAVLEALTVYLGYAIQEL